VCTSWSLGWGVPSSDTKCSDAKSLEKATAPFSSASDGVRYKHANSRCMYRASVAACLGEPSLLYALRQTADVSSRGELFSA
jgi:hypothetical protein